ncbi:hypothetical protein BCR34DRAFT_261593 [Clohesyomyces aquaticus]|uniref:Uncharacterized protein n=1 Tax=Clohesyomyces aquaticus TaxID=1231657 RepID=A0A1Y1ZUW9_9PLEO|nr:hypothetical protein BCR34DRAFT_261593 [Clohesyomyces aquaticus]
MRPHPPAHHQASASDPTTTPRPHFGCLDGHESACRRLCCTHCGLLALSPTLDALFHDPLRQRPGCATLHTSTRRHIESRPSPPLRTLPFGRAHAASRCRETPGAAVLALQPRHLPAGLSPHVDVAASPRHRTRRGTANPFLGAAPQSKVGSLIWALDSSTGVVERTETDTLQPFAVIPSTLPATCGPATLQSPARSPFDRASRSLVAPSCFRQHSCPSRRAPPSRLLGPVHACHSHSPRKEPRGPTPPLLVRER